MQKFTIFSIILSLVVVLTISDVLFNGATRENDVPVVDQSEPAASEETSDSPLTLPSDDSTSDSPVELQEAVDPLVSSSLTETVFQEAGFEDPTLKSTPFAGLIFQLLSFVPSSDATVGQWNLFTGPIYVGTIYEIQYNTDTGGFQGYLNLRDAAKTLVDVGMVNEANNYGDASFYFNHKTKLKTVHLLIRTGSKLYGFEYSQSYHENMKKVFDILKTLQ